MGSLEKKMYLVNISSLSILLTINLGSHTNTVIVIVRALQLVSRELVTGHNKKS